MTDPARLKLAKIRRMIRAGYGAEDVLVKEDVSAPVYWALVESMRRARTPGANLWFDPLPEFIQRGFAMAKNKKSGKRYKNGQLKKPTVYETKSQVLERRMDQLGWFKIRDGQRIYDEGDRKLVDTYGGTYWGMVYLSGCKHKPTTTITPRQHDTCTKFVNLWENYLRAMGFPRDTAKGVDLLAGGGRSVGLDLETRPKEAAEWDSLCASVSHAARANVHAFTMGEPVDMKTLRRALDEVAKHFGD